MGGYATWLWAGKYPNQFKRIAPICGGGDIEDAVRLVNIPIWAFHGEKDEVVLPEESRKMINAIRKLIIMENFGNGYYPINNSVQYNLSKSYCQH